MKPGAEKPVKPARIPELKRVDTIKFAYLKLLNKQNKTAAATTVKHLCEFHFPVRCVNNI